MKLHFEPNLDYQLQAIEAVCDLFRGQEVCRTEFTVVRNAADAQAGLGFAESDLGTGNRLNLPDEEIFANLNDVQLRNGLSPSASLDSGDFTVEMETGTGKTYVYLRTIFELNKRYGFTKFVIVVPSVAIKEGVYKSLQITDDHFRALYSGMPFEYFLYDSAKLGQVRNFATSPQIQIMVVTVGAINKRAVNNLYKDSEKTGEKPIDLIRATRPILIVDEPQSVDGGLQGRGREALVAMNPLCTLRYSATHANEHHMIYRLDAVDAYERKLVKQIEVASATVEDAHNKPYVRLVSTRNQRGTISAKVELDVETATGIRRREAMVQDGDDLEQTTGRAIYHNCRIGEIRVKTGDEFVELRVPGGEHFLRLGQAYGDVDTLAVQREMIRRTIREHLDKEKHLRLQGVKVLNQSNRDNAERAYNLIMRDKEKLLSLETPLKFIFSHSALREGWDNPNVFQICTLRDIRTERERRQTIGRGLRLCVDQKGERQRGFGVNTLTVIATESYEEFAENLQQEIETDTGIRFGVVEAHQFAAIPVVGADGQTTALGSEASKNVWDHLKAEGYIDATGRIEDALRVALEDDTFSVPEEFADQRQEIAKVLRKLAGRLTIKNAAERCSIRPRRAVLHSPEFKALWDRIKHKTTYRVEFDNQNLLAQCIKALDDAPPIPRPRLQWRKADIAIGQSGVEATEREGAASVVLDEDDIELPDVLTELQDRTQLTRRSIQHILCESKRLADFKRNPQHFIELAAQAINRCKRLALVDGVKYQRLGDEYYYAQQLFENEELTGYMKDMLSDATKSVYDQVVYDSEIEKSFAEELANSTEVKVYAKLPGWFTVPTPLGSYNPDWAVLVKKDEGERLYFVVETKASLFASDRRDAERAKIECGKAHFAALNVSESPAHYRTARSLDDLLAHS